MQQDMEFRLAEADGEERPVGSAEEAYREIWRRIQGAFGPDKEIARVVIKGFTGKDSFYALDAADCMDISYLFLPENREELRDYLAENGMASLVPLLRN